MLRKMAEAGNPPRIMRIRQLHPWADWARIWENLHACWTTKAVKANWYRLIHDVLPTNERLQKISLVASSPQCNQCRGSDTVQHRLTECEEGKGSENGQNVD